MQLRSNIRGLLVAAAIALPMLTLPLAQAHAGIILSINIAPPVLPVYAQPVCPGDGYIWTPGYWAYGDEGYFWVPGTWVMAPQPGYLWTPAYWGWDNGVYLFHEGYWGTQVGFYGGINYGFGYGGVGFEGGYWNGGHFFYNRAAGNFGGVHLAYGYSRPLVVANHSTVAFNGGAGGIQARPNQQQLAAARAPHLQPTSQQMQHQSFSSQDRSQLASVNHGHPGVAAASTPASFRSNPSGAARAEGNERSATESRSTGSEAGARTESAPRTESEGRPSSDSRSQSSSQSRSQSNSKAPRAQKSKPQKENHR